MTPTMKLRFVEREITVPLKGEPNFAEYRKVRILQQWWRQSDLYGQVTGMDGEWIDVPLEEES